MTILSSAVNLCKQFDIIIRSNLWRRLLNHAIDGKMFEIIHNLYANARLCGGVGTISMSNIRVWQGKKLPPFQGLFCPSLGAEFRPHSQLKIATFFPIPCLIFPIKKSKKKNQKKKKSFFFFFFFFLLFRGLFYFFFRDHY